MFIAAVKLDVFGLMMLASFNVCVVGLMILSIYIRYICI
jgi:hypothetical protein